MLTPPGNSSRRLHKMNSLDGEGHSVEVTASSSTGQQQHALLNYGCDTIKMQGWTKFKKILNKRADRFLKDPELQYIAVENVSTADIEKIDTLYHCGVLPQMRILYDEEKRLMIVKLMPGSALGGASVLFRELFRELVPRTVGIISTASTTFGRGGRRRKEPDESYMPVATRHPAHDWPLVAVEVGVSECLHQLQQDAWYWLIESVGQVLVVILISISLSSGDMRWE